MRRVLGLRLPLAVALGGLALVLSLFVSRTRPAGGSAGPDRKPARHTAGLGGMAPMVVQEGLPVRAVRSAKEARRKAPSAKRSEPGRVRERASVDLRPMLALFQRELGLTSDQVRSFEDLLRERESTVEKLGEKIRISGVYDRSDCNDRIKTIQADSYRRMERLLIGRQYLRFGEIVAKGGFGDAIALEIPPGVEVRE